MIERVISGGQCGADIAALKTAKRFGIETGGWMPSGFKTLDGPRPQYKTLYNVTEHASWAYPDRTACNVRDSDGTMRFAADFNSPGEVCTRKAIVKHGSPLFDVDLVNLDRESFVKANEWLYDNDVLVLNVAGNTTRTHPLAEVKVTRYLELFFLRLGFEHLRPFPVRTAPPLEFRPHAI